MLDDYYKRQTSNPTGAGTCSFPPLDPAFETKMSDISQLYLTAAELSEQGERVVCIDEISGIQALERVLPDLPVRPGKVLRREFEYIRHGKWMTINNYTAFNWGISVGVGGSF